MAGFFPFSNTSLDLSLFVFRPTVVIIDELLDSLKKFSASTGGLGCVQSSIFKSIHGNMIIWYGGWLKKSCENKQRLTTTLLSMLSNISSMAVLLEHNFLAAYGGQSKDGSFSAKFSTGDIIAIHVGSSAGSGNMDDLAYANLALLKSGFLKMEGSTSGVCFRYLTMPRVICLHVWNSLQSCYSWLLATDLNKSVLPYLDQFSLSTKYDIFKVVYVSTEDVPSSGKFSIPHHVIENGESYMENQG